MDSALSRHELLGWADSLRELLLFEALGGEADEEAYGVARAELLAASDVARVLPEFVRCCCDLRHFRVFIRNSFTTPEERGAFVDGEFRRLLSEFAPRSDSGEGRLPREERPELDALAVQELWKAALDCGTKDMECALVCTTRMLESICRRILDRACVRYGDRDTLATLYAMAADAMDTGLRSPSFPGVLAVWSGCREALVGLDQIRSALDQSRRLSVPVPPMSACEAELLVNLAGSLATYLARVAQTQRAGEPCCLRGR